MLILHSREPGRRDQAPDLAAATIASDIVWIDMVTPSADEIRFVERSTGLTIPSFADLSEIESSSRLRAENGALYLSAPLVFRGETGDAQTTPVGFVLAPHHLVTVRFEAHLGLRDDDGPHPGFPCGSSAEAFAVIIEAIVDRLADSLEHIAAELDMLSHRLFHTGPNQHAANRRPARENADLRVALRRVGRSGDYASKIRDSLLGAGRIVPYVTTLAAPWLPAEVKPRLETLRQDIVSLNDYDAHLVNKVQLLLDTTLGLINVEQNNIIKVLTVVSVVGVPPTLVASMYGMNFRHMPELEWAWGYPYGLALIVVSAIVPLAWFKWRGWL
jgi:magnesium transporter